MKHKINKSNQLSFNKISKKDLIENDKKLLIKKLGFGNLSQSNLLKRKNSFNNKKEKNSSKYKNLKIETSNNIIKNSLLMDFNKNNIHPKITTTTKNSNNISLFLTNENLNPFSEFKKSYESLSKKSIRKNILYKSQKSYIILPKKNPSLNINTFSCSSLNKKIKLINETRNNSNNMTTGQNTLKTNANSKTNFDFVNYFSRNNSIKKEKNKLKIKINLSTPNLLKVKKVIIKDKEKTHQIFNDRRFINKNLYECNNNYKYKPIIKTSNNSKSKTKKKLMKPLNMYKECSNNNKKISLKIKENIINKNKVQNRNKKMPVKLSTITHSDIVSQEKENETNNLNNNKNLESKNSEDTKKESKLDLHNIFNDKILNNLKNKNSIYDIISINLKKNAINKKLPINANHKINEQKTINIEDEENKNYNIIDIKQINELNNKILLNNINLNQNNNEINPINIGSNVEEDKNLNLFIKNGINFSDMNENVNINYNMSEEEHKESSFKTNKNLGNKYYNLINLKIINKEEQEFQSSQDKNNEQTQTTFERNNIISKYIKQPIYNLSPRCFSDEKLAITKYTLNSKSYMFIKEIEKINKNIPIINIKKILSLNEKSIFRLLSFSYDSYISIMSSSILINKKFNICLRNIFQLIIDDFQNKYKNFLKVTNYSFESKSFCNKNKKNSLFNLIIKSKIITQDIKKSYEIGCNYISNGKQYDNIWKFDVQNKKDIKLWICTELGKVNNLNKKFSYTSQVSTFSYNDEIILKLNIFSNGTNLDPQNVEWTEPIISYANTGTYENSKFICSIKYDQLRACEIETQILFWKNKINEEEYEVVENVKKIFSKFFEIKEINYDISKFYFFKFKMIANKIGILKQNRFLSFDINIIDYNESIKNEIQCIYLMNSNFNNKPMEIRLNTCVTFYIIDMKR